MSDSYLHRCGLIIILAIITADKVLLFYSRTEVHILRTRRLGFGAQGCDAVTMLLAMIQYTINSMDV